MNGALVASFHTDWRPYEHVRTEYNLRSNSGGENGIVVRKTLTMAVAAPILEAGSARQPSTNPSRAIKTIQGRRPVVPGSPMLGLVNAFRQGPEAPEPGAPCSDGTGATTLEP